MFKLPKIGISSASIHFQFSNISSLLSDTATAFKIKENCLIFYRLSLKIQLFTIRNITIRQTMNYSIFLWLKYLIIRICEFLFYFQFTLISVTESHVATSRLAKPDFSSSWPRRRCNLKYKFALSVVLI